MKIAGVEPKGTYNPPAPSVQTSAVCQVHAVAPTLVSSLEVAEPQLQVSHNGTTLHKPHGTQLPNTPTNTPKPTMLCDMMPANAVPLTNAPKTPQPVPTTSLPMQAHRRALPEPEPAEQCLPLIAARTTETSLAHIRRHVHDRSAARPAAGQSAVLWQGLWPILTR